MIAVLTGNNISLVESGKGEQSQKVNSAENSVKIQLYGKPKAVAQDFGQAVKVETNAMFVTTPDGVQHKREITSSGVEYSPSITIHSYYSNSKK